VDQRPAASTLQTFNLAIANYLAKVKELAMEDLISRIKRITTVESNASADLDILTKEIPLLPPFILCVEQKHQYASLIATIVPLFHSNNTLESAIKLYSELLKHTGATLLSHIASTILQDYVKPAFVKRPHNSHPVHHNKPKENINSPFFEHRKKQAEMDDITCNYYEGEWKQRPEVVYLLEFVVLELEHIDQTHLGLLLPPLMTLVEDVEVRHRVLGARLIRRVVQVVDVTEFRRAGLVELFISKLDKCLYFCYGQGANEQGQSLFSNVMSAMYSLIVELESAGVRDAKKRKEVEVERSFKVMESVLQMLSFIGLVGGERDDSRVRRDCLVWLCRWTVPCGAKASVLLQSVMSALLDNVEFEANLFAANAQYADATDNAAAQGNRRAIESICQGIRSVFEVCPQRAPAYFTNVVASITFAVCQLSESAGSDVHSTLEELRKTLGAVSASAGERDKLQQELNLLSQTSDLPRAAVDFLSRCLVAESGER
jgi:hypothetical protein